MPYYAFSNTETGESTDLFYHMKDAPSVGSVVEVDGQKWKRELTTSQLAVAGLRPIDPHSAKDFVRKTGEMKGGNVGQLWDYSKEMSEKRAAKDGIDPVKKKFYERYAKNHKGHRHFAEKKELAEKAAKEANAKMEKAGISISLT